MTDEELKQEIEKVKKMISDYESLKTVIAPTSEEYERQMNILLDRLGNLLKMKDKQKAPLGRGFETIRYG